MTFARCTMCGREWTEREDFLADPHLVLIGYQVDFAALTAGLFLFQHETSHCHTCIAVAADTFRDLYDGPVFTERLTGTDACTEYCTRQGNLKPCPSCCECAFVREILQVVRLWPKKDSPGRSARRSGTFDEPTGGH